jgi:DNA polymerase (family X)
MSMNEPIAAMLEEIATLQDLLGADSFRSNSNRRAARSVEQLATDVAALAKDRAALLKVEGIGPKIADKIIEACTTGTMRELAELRASVPAGLLDVLRVPGLGPKTVRMMWTDAKVTSLTDLKRIIDDGSILNLPRMGEKSVERIKASLAFLTSAGNANERLNIGRALPMAERITNRLKDLTGVRDVRFAGSLRRGKETVGDLDILVSLATNAAPDAAKAVSEAFRTMPEVRHVLTAGDTKSSVRFRILSAASRYESDADLPPAGDGPTIQADLRIVPEASFGAALMYFTGSKEHNVAMRERALKRGMTLNEYGLFPEDNEPTPPHHRGVPAIAGATEADVFKALGLAFIPPEIREDAGEFEASPLSGTHSHSVPRLIELDDIKAELHAHTTASDGSMEIEELAARAKERGFHTIAVTDHSRSSPLAGGLQVDRLLTHIEAIRRADEKVKGITILAGSEVDILSDGSLDYEDEILKQLDVVVASPHAALTQDPETATKRLLEAIKNPYVHVLGHPTGRLIQRRPGLAPDLAKLIAAAKQHNVALEINANWLRLDLRDTHVHAAINAGCLIAIDCDVHQPDDFDNLRYGVLTARRGWVTPEQCPNAWTASTLHGWLKSKGRD